MHAIWLGAVLPPLAFVVWAFPKTRRLEIWGCCFWAVLAVTIAWVGIRWLSLESSNISFQSIFFATATAFDLPFIAMSIGCAMNWLIVRTTSQTRFAEARDSDISNEHNILAAPDSKN